jgi:hypothetical protein
MNYESPDGLSYVIPYSLHSNFAEIEMFVRSIQPAILNKVVPHGATGKTVGNIRHFSSYMTSLMYLKQRGPEFFEASYRRPETLSAEYRKCMEPAEHARIRKELGLPELDTGSEEKRKWGRGQPDKGKPVTNNLTLDSFRLKRSATAALPISKTASGDEMSDSSMGLARDGKRVLSNEEGSIIREESQQESALRVQRSQSAQIEQTTSTDPKPKPEVPQPRLISAAQIKQNITSIVPKITEQLSKAVSIKSLMQNFIKKGKPST